MWMWERACAYRHINQQVWICVASIYQASNSNSNIFSFLIPIAAISSIPDYCQCYCAIPVTSQCRNQQAHSTTRKTKVYSTYFALPSFVGTSKVWESSSGGWESMGIESAEVLGVSVTNISSIMLNNDLPLASILVGPTI